MKRREFITLVGGAARMAARGACAAKVKLPTIGLLGGGSPSAQAQWTAAFVQRLRELGWVEGQTVAIEYRWVEGRFERIRDHRRVRPAARSMPSLPRTTPNILAAKQVNIGGSIVFPRRGSGRKAKSQAFHAQGHVTGLSSSRSELAQR